LALARRFQKGHHAAVDGGEPDLLELVRRARTLCLNVDNPGWDDARGYLFHDATSTLYFPVPKKYLPENGHGFRVLIWSQPRVLVTGVLSPATSDGDLAIQLTLAERDIGPEKARYMLLNQRTNRPRRTRHKLVIEELTVRVGR